MSYDLRGNVVLRRRTAAPGSDLADIEMEAEYPPSLFGLANGWPIGCVAASQRVCNKPLWTEDANDNRTDYSYDPAHGGVLSVAGPAVEVVGATRTRLMATIQRQLTSLGVPAVARRYPPSVTPAQ